MQLRIDKILATYYPYAKGRFCTPNKTNMKLMSLYILISFFFLACGKNENGNEAAPPSNLTLAAVVSTDNSGNVSFTATANNAVSYEYDFGNGVFQNSTDGRATYKYPASGA